MNCIECRGHENFEAEQLAEILKLQSMHVHCDKCGRILIT